MAADDTRMRDLRDLAKVLSDGRLAEAERSDLIAYHFVESVRQLRVLRRLGLAFANEREDEMPPQIAQQVREVMRKASEQLDAMVGFQVEQPNAEQVHRQIASEVLSGYNTMVGTLRVHIRGNVDSAAAVTRLDDSTARAERLVADVEATHERAESLVNRGETLTAEIAAGTLSSYYDKQAQHHKDVSKTFLVAAGVAAATVAILAVVLFVTIEERATSEWTAYVRDLGVRVFVLGLGLYVVSFMVRAYRANQHLLVINAHKANALKTFLLFQASASEDGGSRDLITAELVKAVFAADETGFLENAPDRTVVDGQTGLLALLAQQRQA